MAIRFLWFSYLVDPLLIVFMGFLGVWINRFVTDENKSTFSRISAYLLKAVALTAALVGISSFPSVFSSGTNGESMILLAFITIVVGTLIGSWTNFDEKLERWIQKKWSAVTISRNTNGFVRFVYNLEEKKQEKDKSFGWAAAYATYVSLVGVLSIMGPIHESTDGVLNFIVIKCVLDTVATLVFAMNWGPGVLLSAGFVLVWQVFWGILAPYFLAIINNSVVSFADGVGGLIIMCMGLSVAGILKGHTEDKGFRTGNLFPAMILAFIVGYIAVKLNFFW